jgi:hypothetical protein
MTRRLLLLAFALPWVLALGSMALERLDNIGRPGHAGLGSPPAWLIAAVLVALLPLVARSALGRVLIAGIVALGLATVVAGWKLLAWALPHLADFRFGLEPAKVLRRFRYAMQCAELAGPRSGAGVLAPTLRPEVLEFEDRRWPLPVEETNANGLPTTLVLSALFGPIQLATEVAG